MFGEGEVKSFSPLQSYFIAKDLAGPSHVCVCRCAKNIGSANPLAALGWGAFFSQTVKKYEKNRRFFFWKSWEEERKGAKNIWSANPLAGNFFFANCKKSMRRTGAFFGKRKSWEREKKGAGSPTKKKQTTRKDHPKKGRWDVQGRSFKR